MRKPAFALVLLVACSGGPHYTVIDAGADTTASCVALPYTCGAGGNDSCCNSPEVIGGTYFRSYTVAGDGISGDKSAPATISTFRLDKYEVTVARFRQFVVANQGTQQQPPAPGTGAQDVPGSGWDSSWNAILPKTTDDLIAELRCDPMYQTWTDQPGNNDNRPINCISWYEAMAFCAWDRGHLPTEAQWNYAAAGGDQQRAYPWSSPTSSAVIDSSYANYSCLGDINQDCSIADLGLVGTKPAGEGRWGHSDLAGNIGEWTLDYTGLYANPCNDCVNLAPPSSGLPDRISRGGDFRYGDFQLRTSFRGVSSPGSHFVTQGIRCARKP